MFAKRISLFSPCLIVLFLFCIPSEAAPKCEFRKCTESQKKPIDLCFIEYGFLGNVHRDLSAFSNCGYFSTKYYVNGRKSVEAILDGFRYNCKTVRKVTFFSHGAPGSMPGVGLDVGQVSYLKKYACLFEDKTEIQLVGCNVGHGCRGDMLLKELAENILSKSSGTITAPTFYASTFLPGVVPHFSLNGSNRRINYDPRRIGTLPDWWTHSDKFGHSGEPMEKKCRDEINQLVADIFEEKKKASKKKCDLNVFYLTGNRMSEFMRVAMNLSPYTPWNYGGVEDELTKFNFQLEDLQNCQPSRSGNQRDTAQ